MYIYLLLVPQRLDTVLCGFNEEREIVFPCDLHQASVIIDHPVMDRSTANTGLLEVTDEGKKPSDCNNASAKRISLRGEGAERRTTS